MMRADDIDEDSFGRDRQIAWDGKVKSMEHTGDDFQADTSASRKIFLLGAPCSIITEFQILGAADYR